MLNTFFSRSRRGCPVTTGARASNSNIPEPLEPRRLFSSISTVADFPVTSQSGPPTPFYDGQTALGGLVADRNGNVYGTTSQGGSVAGAVGTIFEIPAGSSSITLIANFTGANGQTPMGAMILDAAGNLYGTTSAGGANGDGEIFEVVKGSGQITVLASFSGSNGSAPDGALLRDSDGNLFSTASSGGASGDGDVFELAAGSSSITDLGDFNGANGSAPKGALVMDSQGNLFGTTSLGGNVTADAPNGLGTIFEIPAGEGTLTTVYAFDGIASQLPDANLAIDSGDNLYFTAAFTSGQTVPVIQELPQGGGSPITLATFDNSVIALNGAGPILDGAGNLFCDDSSTVYEFVQGGSAPTAVGSLAAANVPQGPLALSPSGNLYGVTLDGGANAGGYIFQVSGAATAPTVGPAAQLGFVTPPVNTDPGVTIPVSVEVEDTSGNLVAADTSTITIVVTSSFSGVVPGGTYTAAAVGGVATFNVAAPTTAGAYLIDATDGMLTPASSNSFTVGSAALSLDLTPTLAGPASSTVIAGTRLKLKEKLTLAAGSSAVSGTSSARILLSPDETSADSVLTLAAAGGKLKLKANKGKNFNLRLPKTILPNISAGTYHVLIELTDTTGATATIDSGQTINLVAPVVDLTGSFVKVPATVKAGKRATATFLVTNTSAANVATTGNLPFDVDTSPDGQLADAVVLESSHKHINLKPGKSMRVTVSGTITASTFLVINLDPGNVAFLNDVNPANNSFATSQEIVVG
jgi:uncharacterized repeat protein (TIGR03803 family)